MKVTFEAKIRDTSLYPLLEAFAALFGCGERALFRDHWVGGEPLRGSKGRYLPVFGRNGEWARDARGRGQGVPGCRDGGRGTVACERGMRRGGGREPAVR